MTDPTRAGERFVDDPEVELNEAEREAALSTVEHEADDITDLDDRPDNSSWAWDDLDRSPVGAETPAPAPADPEFTVDPIDTSAEQAAGAEVASDPSFDRASGDDLVRSEPVEPAVMAPPAGEGRYEEPVGLDRRDELVEDRGGDDRGVAYLPPERLDEPARRDPSGRTEQRFDLGDIKKVEIEGPATVNISTTGTGLLIVSAVGEDFDRIHVMEGRKDVKVSFDGGFMDRRHPSQDITYTLNLTGLTDLKLEKQVVAQVDRVEGGTVTVDLKGGTRLTVGALDVKRLEAKLVDKCHLTAAGTADRQVVDLTGESIYDGGRVQTDRTAVKAKDKSQASLRVKTLLRAQASKHSTVHYAGEDIDLDIHTEDHSEVRNVAAH